MNVQPGIVIAKARQTAFDEIIKVNFTTKFFKAIYSK